MNVEKCRFVNKNKRMMKKVTVDRRKEELARGKADLLKGLWKVNSPMSEYLERRGNSEAETEIENVRQIEWTY